MARLPFRGDAGRCLDEGQSGRIGTHYRSLDKELQSGESQGCYHFFRNSHVPNTDFVVGDYCHSSPNDGSDAE